MPTSDPIEILLAHDEWATRQLLVACQGLTKEQFHWKFEIGPGSLHDAITHILGAMRHWGHMLAGREQGARLENSGERTPADLLVLLDEIASDFARSARAHPLDEIVTGVRRGKTVSFPRAIVITHVATHAMHHRAQCLNMLRHLGVSPLPPSSVVEWNLMANARP